METDKKRGKRFLGISAIIVMVLVALALLPAVAVATTISIGDVTVSPGESATLSIMINDVTDCGVAAITFSYNPSVVHVTEVKDSQFDVCNPIIDNDTGEFEIAGLQFWSGGLDGTVQLASVTLKAIGTEGQWSFLNITIDELKTVGPPSQNIPANLDNGTFNIQMNNPPMPTITNPQDGDTLSGLITIEEIDESGEQDIVYNLFEYYYDENCNCEADDGNDWYEIGNDTDGSDGWSVDWNTTQYPDGCYMIRATMGDNHGRTGTTEIDVKIDNSPIIVTRTPIVTNASATPAIIPDDTDNDPKWGEIATLNVSVISQSSVSVTINLSAIGGLAVQPMTNIEGDIWSVTTNASDGKAGWSGTAYEPYLLQVNATNEEGKSNTSVSIELMVMKNGDVDGDGEVSYSDAMYLYKWKARKPGFETIHETIADVDGNGEVSYSDAMYLHKWKARKPGFEVLH